MKKGMTLVEILVALAISLILFGCAFEIHLNTIKADKMLKEYRYFESISLDIDKRFDSGGEEWVDDYFTSEMISEEEGKKCVYYDVEFNPTNTDADKRYKLSYFHDENNHFIVNIVSIKQKDGTLIDGTPIIENLDYGGIPNETP